MARRMEDRGWRIPPSFIFGVFGLRFLDGQRAICYRVKEFKKERRSRKAILKCKNLMFWSLVVALQD